LLKPENSSGFIRDGGEDDLSMEALVELLKAVVEKGRPFRIQALGFSMDPFIKNKNYITISPLSPDRPQLGDIVAFIQQRTGKLVVHRVVESKKNQYLIKGDNTSAPDGLVPKGNILGYVTKIDKDGKTVRFGSGPEKVFIAFVSRKNLLRPTLHLTYRLISPFRRRIKA
jgi:signal peptidase I